MYLEPTSKHTIPIHPSAVDGWDTNKLCVDIHEFPGANSNKRVAFLFSHSSGFHKEMLHPIMRRLRDQLRSMKEHDQTDFTFVSWDSRFHGDSARLNEKYITDRFITADNAMDMKQVIDMFDLNTSKYDKFIGVGYSLGSLSMLLCEYFYPNSFDGMCLMEPILSTEFHPTEIRLLTPTMSANKKREEWKNLQECRDYMLSKKFYQNFHPEAFALYLNYGLYETESGTVKLKCPKHIDYVIMNYSLYDSYVCHKSVESISIPAQFVLGNNSFFFRPDLTGSILETKNTNMVAVDILEGTHNLPNENPDSTIPSIMKLINKVNNKVDTIKAKL